MQPRVVLITWCVHQSRNVGGGQCRLCELDEVFCDGVCIDPLTNASYCGASDNCNGANAGTICKSSQICVGGVCQCSPSKLDCDNDPTNGCEMDISNASNCGGCGNVCPSESGTQVSCDRYSEGSYLCDVECTTEHTCGCIPLTKDSHNCGSCGHVCNSGETCEHGVCQAVTCGHEDDFFTFNCMFSGLDSGYGAYNYGVGCQDRTVSMEMKDHGGSYEQAEADCASRGLRMPTSNEMSVAAQRYQSALCLKNGNYWSDRTYNGKTRNCYVPDGNCGIGSGTQKYRCVKINAKDP